MCGLSQLDYRRPRTLMDESRETRGFTVYFSLFDHSDGTFQFYFGGLASSNGTSPFYFSGFAPSDETFQFGAPLSSNKTFQILMLRICF